MRITNNDLNNMVKRLNATIGKENADYNTAGAYRLYKDAFGYALHRVMNSGGGVFTVANCYGMTARECYFLLCGLLA